MWSSDYFEDLMEDPMGVFASGDMQLPPPGVPPQVACLEKVRPRW